MLGFCLKLAEEAIDDPEKRSWDDVFGALTPVCEDLLNMVSEMYQSELPRPIPLNSVQSDLGCTSRIYFDNVTLMSQKPCQPNNKCDCTKTNGYE